MEVMFKSFVIILFFFVVNTSCSQTIDSLLIECTVEKYKAKNVSINSVLESYEKYLIESGFLDSNLETRFTTYFTRVVCENNLIGSIPDSLFSRVSVIPVGRHLDSTCLASVKELDDLDLSSYAKITSLRHTMNSGNGNENSPSQFGLSFLATFTEEDMQTPLIRMTILLMIAWISDLNNSFEKTGPMLPPMKQ